MPKRPIAKAKPKAKAKAKSASSLTLTGDCGLSQVATLKSRLTQVLARATPVTLDLSTATRIDTASLQLLVAFVRERQAQGRAVVWQGVPSWFEETAQRLGLTAALAMARA